MKNTISFKGLNLIEPLERALTKQGYTIPTLIQSKSIPSLLHGKDLIGIAQTGTGKTAAFILPILQRMRERHPRVIKTLVLAPTRELAAQIGESFATYGKFLRFKHTVIFGGVRQIGQVRALSRGVDILVATPGRLLDLMNQKRLTLKYIEFFVLDEADRMLDMGFLPDIKRIISRLPPKRQSLFFSATMSPKINELARNLLKNPVHVKIATQTITVESVKQHIFFVDHSSKEKLLLKLLKYKHLTHALVFTRTKHRANKLAISLRKNHISADAIHGDKTQGARTRVIRDFKTGKIKVLVATDIAARGIDINNISHVINFELPSEPESYIHRIGRTARAGAKGTAFSFCSAEERNYLHEIEDLIGQNIEVMDHKFHSETAKNAVGAAAKPAPRTWRRFSRDSKPAPNNRRRFSRSSRSASSSRRRFSRSSKSSSNRGRFSRNSKPRDKHKSRSRR